MKNILLITLLIFTSLNCNQNKSNSTNRNGSNSNNAINSSNTINSDSASIKLYAQKNVLSSIGKFEIFSLTEREGVGNVNILIDPPADVLQKFAPDSTFANSVRAFLIKTDKEIYLVDTGFGRDIFSQMDSLGVSPDMVTSVLITHMHGDHIGGLLINGKPTFPNAKIVVSAKEFEYWTSKTEMTKLPENRRGNFTIAQKIFDLYGPRVHVQQPAMLALDGNNSYQDFPDGIQMIAAYGHTPGHVMYLVKDGAQELLIWGDLMHAYGIQTAHPEISVKYDIDPVMASQTRIQVLRYTKAKNIPAIGMHMPSNSYL